MKKLLLIFVFLIFCYSVHPIKIYSQVPSFKWAKRAGGTEGEYGRSIAIDGSGNCFITGRFYGMAKFDMITLSSFGGHDIFIAKYDSSGNVLWAKQAGGIGYDEGISIVTEERGNSYIIGYYEGNVTFGTNTLNSAGGKDIFIAKYSPSGNVVWVKRAGGIEEDYGQEISMDGSGNIYLTGYFHGAASFESITLTSQGGSDTFLAKYDSSGILIWIKQPSSVATDRGYGISTDESGNSVITGYFEKTITFGNISLTSGGNYPDAFIAKYDASGNALWARRVGGSSNVQGSAICINNQGESIVTGIFNGTVNFGSSTFTTAGSNDIFAAKYDASGNLLWAKQLGGSGGDECYDIAASNSNSFLMTGRFGDIVNFGSTRLTCWGGLDIFIVKYNSFGNIEWVKQAGGTEIDEGYGIIADRFGDIYLTGLFAGNAFFDQATITCAGTHDIFIARLYDVESDTISPMVPQNLQANSSDKKVTLTWSPNTESDLAYYKIYRSQAHGFVPGAKDSLAIVFKPASSYNDQAVINGQTYYYRISAVDNSGNESGFSNEVSATPKANKPTMPKNFHATAGDQKVTLSWSQNPESDLSHYQIYRSQLQGFIPAITDTLAMVLYPDNNYIDTEVINGLTYYYRISAVNVASDESDYSAEASATPQAGITIPNIVVSALEHNFGDVPLFSTASWQVTVENKGTANLEVNNIGSSNPVFSASAAQFIIEPGSNHSFYAQFTPDSLKTEQGTLAILSNDPDQSDLKITLSGKGIDNQSPEIILAAPSQKMWVNAEYLLSAQIKDNWAIKSALLYYRKGIDENFQSFAMSQGQGENYQVNIPGSVMTLAGLAYFIKAEDLSGNATFSDTLSQAIYFVDGALTTSSSQSHYQAGFPRGEWHQISAPAILDQPSLAAVLNDETELGSYGEPNWRLFSYQDTNGDNVADSYMECRPDVASSIFRFDSGKAYWLKANPVGAKIEIDVGAGYVLPLEPQTIPLKPGWNQIGNPFAFPISFSPNDSRIVNKSYLPDGKGGYQLTTNLLPWAGYFVFVNGNGAVDLKLAPIPDNPLNKTIADDVEWLFQINASCGTSTDQINYLGISETSTDEWDSNDYPEPPAIGEYISLYFPHEDWQESCKNFTSDFRNSVGEGQVWNLMETTNQKSSEVNLSWNQLITADENLQFQLYDCNRNKTIDMKVTSDYHFSRSNQEASSPFQILVGSSEFIERQVNEIRSQLPSEFYLFQNYPNPFNSTTQIRFQLPMAEKVSLKILNLMGREVRALLNEHRAAGDYQILWNGKDNQGNEAGTGVYLCVFQAGGYVESRKVLLLK